MREGVEILFLSIPLEHGQMSFQNIEAVEPANRILAGELLPDIAPEPGLFAGIFAVESELFGHVSGIGESGIGI